MAFSRSLKCFNWKLGGIVIGWLGIALNLGYGGYYALELIIFALFMYGEIFILAVILGFFLHLTSFISWLFGIAKTKPILMLIPLIWWGLLLSAWNCILVYLISDRIQNDTNYYPIHKDVVFIASTCLVAGYFVAVMSYKSIKESANINHPSEHPQLTVTYSSAIKKGGFELFVN